MGRAILLLLPLLAGCASDVPPGPRSTYRWSYVEQGGDPAAFPGPLAHYGGLGGFACMAESNALRFGESMAVFPERMNDFSLRAGNASWTGPTGRIGGSVWADIPLDQPVVRALARRQRQPLGIRFGPYAYKIPHDPIVQRVARECLRKSGRRQAY